MISADEVVALAISVFLAVVTWCKWSWVAISVKRYNQSRTAGVSLLGGVALGAVLLLFVLGRWSSSDVRDSTIYTSFYFAMGLGFTGMVLAGFDRLGLSVRDDVFERFNPAAAITLAGTTVGTMVAFAGANIGDGPGWWVVVFCAAMSNGALLLGWAMLDLFTNVGERITVDRDVSTAWRAAGWFAATGIIYGRAVAGTWLGIDAAMSDFVMFGIGGLVLLVIALVAELGMKRGTLPRSAVTGGVLPGIVYVALAIAYVSQLPPWK